MTNEQITAVAEEVWGWRINGNGIILKPCGTISVTAITVDELRKDVNSWQGFGRTVEAMAKREILFKTLPNILSTYLAGNSTIEWLFEATHLAALEAKRKEKEDAEGS